MASSQSKWGTFLEDNLLDDPPQSNAFFWCGLNEQSGFSVDNSCSKKDVDDQHTVCTRKRSREPCNGTGSKACREKMRRDRLNDRFTELSTILEPEKPPKPDKTVILSEAIHVLNQLRAEAQQLRHSNDQLHEGIKVLKAEKNELREEKSRLKTQKDQLEQQLKANTLSTGYLPHPTQLHAAMAAFAAQSQATGGKATLMPGYPGMAMWQWMTPATLDTSQDHVLRPPVA